MEGGTEKGRDEIYYNRGREDYRYHHQATETVWLVEQSLTLAPYSSIFIVSTVVNKQTVVGAVRYVSFLSGAAHVVQHDWPFSTSKVSIGESLGSFCR